MTNELFGKFEITAPMKKWVKENKSGLLSGYLGRLRDTGIDFCDKFNTEGTFDLWGNPEGDMYLMYVASIGIGHTIIIDGDVYWDNTEDFLKTIEEMENRITELKTNIKKSPSK